MNQSKTGSLVETLTNFVAGLVLSILSYWFLLPLFGIHIPLIANLYLTGYFAVMSFVKTYLIRRAFNASVQREMSRLPTRVGSIQSLRRSSGVPGMSQHDYKDVVGGYESKPEQATNGQCASVDATATVKEDKELRE